MPAEESAGFGNRLGRDRLTFRSRSQRLAMAFVSGKIRRREGVGTPRPPSGTGPRGDGRSCTRSCPRTIAWADAPSGPLPRKATRLPAPPRCFETDRSGALPRPLLGLEGWLDTTMPRDDPHRRTRARVRGMASLMLDITYNLSLRRSLTSCVNPAPRLRLCGFALQKVNMASSLANL